MQALSYIYFETETKKIKRNRLRCEIPDDYEEVCRLEYLIKQRGEMTLWTYNLLGVVSSAITPRLNPMATVHLRFTDYNYSFNTVTVANKSHGVLD